MRKQPTKKWKEKVRVEENTQLGQKRSGKSNLESSKKSNNREAT